MTKLAIYSLTWIYACVTIAAPSTDVSTHNRVIILIFTMMILIYCLKASHKRRFGNFNKFPVRLTSVNRFNTRDICYLSRKKSSFRQLVLNRAVAIAMVSFRSPTSVPCLHLVRIT